MTGGYIVLKEDLANLILENALAAAPFVYDGAYDYILSIILSGKPIIFNGEISFEAGAQSGTSYTHDIISAGVAKDKVSLIVWYQNNAYDVSVLKSAKNNVTITAIGG